MRYNIHIEKEGYMSYICDNCPIKNITAYSGICDQCKPYCDILDKLFNQITNELNTIFSDLKNNN